MHTPVVVTQRLLIPSIHTQAHQYDPSLLGTKYNTRLYYGWEAGLKPGVTVPEEKANTGKDYQRWRNEALEVRNSRSFAGLGSRMVECLSKRLEENVAWVDHWK